jgi:hypothetical protein
LSTTVNKNNELTEVGGVTTKSPADLKFQNRQVITVGFGPADQPLPKPPGQTILALEQTLQGAGPVATTTTTPAASSTTTSLPTTTSTTAPPSTTTTRSSGTTTTR